MVYDAMYGKGEVGYSRQYMWVDTWMIRGCFCSRVNFFVLRNDSVPRHSHEGDCECVGVESREDKEDPLSNKGQK